ncbi:MAG: cytochrome D1 domain-containing protein [Sulfuricellaceae bacterium]|jgi:protein NirF
MRASLLLAVLSLSLAGCAAVQPRGTGDLGVVIERASGKVQLVETSGKTVLGEVAGLGDLSHATVVFSRDERYAYVFGRDGGLTKVDLLARRIVKRVVQSGNSIGGAISADGRLVAAANYTPGGVKFFDADTLAQVAEIPAVGADGKPSKVVGLVDAPGNRFVFTLYDAGEIWLADMKDPAHPKVTKFPGIGKEPYDGNITPDSRWYLAGLFGEDGLALLDLWHPEKGVKRILKNYGKGEQKLPVFKMPHMEGWGFFEHYALVPAVGHHEVLMIDTRDWTLAGAIPTAGQPVFVVGQPGSRKIWVNFAFPDNGVVQVIDAAERKVVHTLHPGKAVLHLEFTPRGENVWISARDSDKLVVYDTDTYQALTELPSDSPSGVFFTPRAHRIGW